MERNGETKKEKMRAKIGKESKLEVREGAISKARLSGSSRSSFIIDDLLNRPKTFPVYCYSNDDKDIEKSGQNHLGSHWSHMAPPRSNGISRPHQPAG